MAVNPRMEPIYAPTNRANDADLGGRTQPTRQSESGVLFPQFHRLYQGFHGPIIQYQFFTFVKLAARRLYGAGIGASAGI